MTKVITICNHKGGVGKTCTVVNTGAALAKRGKRTLLIDTDAQANMTTGFGYDPDNIKIKIHEILFDGANAKDSVLHTTYKNLDIIPSTPHMIVADDELARKKTPGAVLKGAISSVVGDYDYVIFDTPPSLNRVTLNALNASNRVIIPVQCHYEALKGMALIEYTINEIHKKDNKELELGGILLTMADGRTRLTRSVKDQVRKEYGKKVFNTIIPVNIALAEAPLTKKPIFEEYPDSSGAKAYSEFALEVIRRL